MSGLLPAGFYYKTFMWPASFWERVYEPMIRHMEDYVALVNKDPVAGMEQYLAKYIYGPKSWTEFLNLIGIDEVLEAARAGASIYDA